MITSAHLALRRGRWLTDDDDSMYVSLPYGNPSPGQFFGPPTIGGPPGSRRRPSQKVIPSRTSLSAINFDLVDEPVMDRLSPPPADGGRRLSESLGDLGYMTSRRSSSMQDLSQAGSINDMTEHRDKFADSPKAELSDHLRMRDSHNGLQSQKNFTRELENKLLRYVHSEPEIRKQEVVRRIVHQLSADHYDNVQYNPSYGRLDVSSHMTESRDSVSGEAMSNEDAASLLAQLERALSADSSGLYEDGSHGSPSSQRLANGKLSK